MSAFDPNARLRCRVLTGLGAAIFLAVVVAPCAGLTLRLIMNGKPPTDGWWFTSRQWELLAYTLGLAGAGTVLAMLLAWPAAAALARGTGWITWTGMLAILLIPPMVSCFGWQRLLNATTPPQAWANAAVVCLWGLWIWPLPAMMLGSAWRRAGHEAFEAALTCCGPARAFFAVGAPAIRSALSATLLTVFVILTGEYLVPHAWALKVYSTELLAWAISTDRAIDAVYPAVPLCACVLLGSMLVVRQVRKEAVTRDESQGAVRIGRRGLLRGVPLILVSVSCAIPIGGLIWRLGSVAILKEVLTVHRDDLIGSLWVCAVCALAVVAMSAGLSILRPVARQAGWATLLLGILPGAVVGTAITASYGRFPPTSDHWVKLAAGLAARFGWLAWLAVVVATRGNRAIEEQAEMDGADRPRIAWSIRIARSWPMLAASGLAAFALALSELATTTQAQVSAFMPISLVLVDKMHKFEHGYVMTISLVLAAAALPGVAAAAWASRRMNS